MHDNDMTGQFWLPFGTHEPLSCCQLRLGSFELFSAWILYVHHLHSIAVVLGWGEGALFSLAKGPFSQVAGYVKRSGWVLPLILLDSRSVYIYVVVASIHLT